MDNKRRSSRLASSQVNYSEAQPRKAADNNKAPAATTEGDQPSQEEEEEHELAPPERPNAKKQKATGRPATGSTTQPAGEADSEGEEEQDGDEPGPSVRKRQKVAPPAATTDVKDKTLFEIVWKHGNTIPYMARQWLEHYKTERTEATAQAMTLLLQAGGCDRTVESEDAEDGNADEMVEKFADILKHEGSTNPFQKASKQFQSNYMKMWDRIVHEVHHADLLQDHYIMDKISNFVIAMSVSPVRSFRHAATLTASQLISSWVNTLLALTEAQNTSNQQLEAERKKKTSKVVQERITMLTKAVERKRRAVSEVQVLVNNLMDAVFANRFRDVDMSIRALVIKGISHWIHLHPPMFLADQYLKYVAWGLSDKDDVVRAAAVDGLLKLYGEEDNVLPLREFTKRFTNRFMELPYDIDIQVAVRGARLLDRLVAVKQLDRANVRDLYRLLADDSSDLRRAVSDVVVRLLENATAQESQGGAVRSKPDMNTAQAQLLGLLKIMTQLADPKPASRSSGASGPSTSAGGAESMLEPLDDATVTGVVDALYDRLSILQDWNVLCVALLDDRLAALRGSIDDLHLARVLKAAVQLQASKTEGKKPKGRGVRAAKEAVDAANNNLQTMSLVLMKQLPRLLQKFSTDGPVVSSLLDIIPSIQLEVYSLKQQEKDLEELTQQVSDLLLKHSHQAALKSAANTLLYLAEKSPSSLQDSTQLVLSEALDTIGAKLADVHRAAQAVPEDELKDAVEEASQGGQGNSQLFNLHLALLRVNVLQTQGCNTLGTREDVSSTLENIIEEAGEGRNYGAGVIGAAALSVFLTSMWRLRHIITTPTLLHATDANAPVSEFISTRNSVLAKLTNVLKAIEDQSVRDAVITVLVDMILVVGSRHAWLDTPVEEAELHVSDEVVQAVWEHCIDVLDRDESTEPSGEEDTPDETQNEAATDSGKANAKLAAVAGVGRLLAFNVLSDHQSKRLGPLFVALLGGHGKAVTEVVKDVCRHIRKNKPGMLPNIYLSAMTTSFNAARMTATDSREALEAAMQDFSTLCATIASTYAGHNISKGPLLHICEGGVDFALEEIPSHLPFLEWGLCHFTPKLQAEAAEQLLEELEERVADVDRNLEDTEWSSFDLYTKGLKERANTAKVTTRGVLKQPLNLEPTVQRTSRRISFAGDEEEPADVQDARASPPAGEPQPQSDDPEDDQQETQGQSGDDMEVDTGNQEPSSHHGAEEDTDNQEPSTRRGPEEDIHTQDPSAADRMEEENDEEEDDQGTPEVEYAAPTKKTRAGSKQSNSLDQEDASEQLQEEVPQKSTRPTRAGAKSQSRAAPPAQPASKKGRKGRGSSRATDEEHGAPETEAVPEGAVTTQEEEEAPATAATRNRKKASIAIMPGPAVQTHDNGNPALDAADTSSLPSQRLTDGEEHTAPSTSAAAPSSGAMPSGGHETQDLNLESTEEPSQQPSGSTRGRRGTVAAKTLGSDRVTRRATRASSQEVTGSQAETAGALDGGGKARGRRRGASQQQTEEDSQPVSLDSLGGMMPTEEQLPFASEPTPQMSDPEALPHPKGSDADGGVRTRGLRQRSKAQSQEEEEAQDEGGHARKRRRR